MADITPLHPKNGDENTENTNANPPEDPFESLLDEESDEDFGYVVTRERAAGPDGRPVKLAEWSAQDFSSIYTRFRPHLERHARRFLNNQSQVDEVVQDAFLYLMVSLPELDSEIGVLRFMKWKTRLLCLDVIRASGRTYLASIDDVAEPASNDPEISSNLEQQDDAAVLRLALSKLNPRHREVLLASIYEEKTTDEIAAQVGLSENATRQLIFRARSAFKKALLGDDVNTAGMSAAAILSVAARKAAHDAKKVGAQAMVFALFLMVAVGAFLQVGGRGTQEQNLADVETPGITTPTADETDTDTGTTGTETTDPTGTPTSDPTHTSPSNNTSIATPSTTDPATPSPAASHSDISAEAKIYKTTEVKEFSSLASVFLLGVAQDGTRYFRITTSEFVIDFSENLEPASDTGRLSDLSAVAQTPAGPSQLTATAIWESTPGSSSDTSMYVIQVTNNTNSGESDSYRLTVEIANTLESLLASLARS